MKTLLKKVLKSLFGMIVLHIPDDVEEEYSPNDTFLEDTNVREAQSIIDSKITA